MDQIQIAANEYLENKTERNFTVLYNHCRKYFYKYSNLYYSNINEKDKEFCIDDALTNIYKYIYSYDKNKSSFVTWSTSVLINSLNYTFRRNKVTAKHLFYVDDFYNHDREEETNYNDIRYIEMSLEELLDALDNNKDIMIDKYIHKLSIKEISEKHNVNENTIKTRLRKAKEDLKKHYEH